MGKFDRRVNMAGKARLGFGIRAKLGRGSPFVGGAYIYIDPTPSKNILETASTFASAATVQSGRAGAWDERRLAREPGG